VQLITEVIEAEQCRLGRSSVQALLSSKYLLCYLDLVEEEEDTIPAGDCLLKQLIPKED
jgi:hypothetical protein